MFPYLFIQVAYVHYKHLLHTKIHYIIDKKYLYRPYLYKTLSLLYNIVTLLYKPKQMTSSTAKRYTTTEYGKQNMFAAEPPIQYVENYKGYGLNAEQLNGRLAMIGFVAALTSYISSGSIFFFGAFGI